MKTDNLLASIQPFLTWIKRYRALLFFVGLSLVYGYVIVRINTINNAEPNPVDVTSSIKNNNPSIDPTVVNKIEQLKNDNANVQALFDRARQNPFKE